MKGKRKKFNLIFVGIFLFVFLFGLVSAVSSYSSSNYQMVNSGRTSSFFNSGTPSSTINFDSKVCQQGTDFIIQIAPGGCTPTVVRSDLLEQQDVPVFCKIQMMKINPAIKIDQILSIDFGGKFPKDVSGINFIPAYPALGRLDLQLNNFQWNDVGYAVIFLNKNSNESSMPDYVEGNLSARVKYTAFGAFGPREQRTFYLPLMSDKDFNELQGRYSFLNHMGYLRADTINLNSASISIYSALNANPSSGNTQKQRVLTKTLNVGETSGGFFLPGFGCLASSNLRLDAITGIDTRASISVNGEDFQVKKGEAFLDGKCQVTDDPKKQGLRQSVEISCQTDNGGVHQTLSIEPVIKLKITTSAGTTEKDYKTGDWLYDEGDSSVYLGYVGTNPNVNSLNSKNSVIFLIKKPTGTNHNRLDAETVTRVATVADNKLRSDKTALEIVKSFWGVVSTSWDWLKDNKYYKRVDYGSPQKAFGATVQITGFGSGSNMDLQNKDLKNYHQKAVEDYEKIQSSYANSKDPTGNPSVLGEQSLVQLINLSNILNQNEDLKKYCDDFKANYKDSRSDVSPCEGIPKYFNAGVSSQTYLIGGDYKEISFNGVNVPSADDYGVEITVKRGTETQTTILRKGQKIYLASMFSGLGDKNEEYIKLNQINDKKSANLDLVLLNKSLANNVRNFITNPPRNLDLNTPYSVGGTDYIFTINKINLKKVAQVSLQTNIRDYSNVKFKFKIGIEKRSIKLSPDQIKSQIKSFREVTNKLHDISNSLGKLVNTFQTVCENVGRVLLVKNLVFSSGTESLARAKVMQGDGGWDAKCETLNVNGKTYHNVDECLLDNSDEIENEVNQVQAVMDDQNKNFKELEKIPGVTTSGGLFSKSIVNQQKLIESGYSDQVVNELPSSLSDPTGNGEQIDMGVVKQALSPEGFKNNLYSLDEAREIELYSQLYKENPDSSVYKQKLYSILYTLQQNAKVPLEQKTFLENLGLKEGQGGTIATKKPTKKIDVTQLATFKDIKSHYKTQDVSLPEKYTGIFKWTTDKLRLIKDSEPVYPIQDSTTGESYLLVLNGDYSLVSRTFHVNADGTLSLVTDSMNPLNVQFNKLDPSKSTVIKDPKVKCYDSSENSKLPAIVPVDTANGWYAYITAPSPTISTTSTIPSKGGYDASARVNSFYLCNVGSNGLMEYAPMNDNCAFIDLGNTNTFHHSLLSADEASKMIDKAVKNIRDASVACASGAKNVEIDGDNYDIGQPAVSTSTLRCTDIWSPTDCKILFNACDPVVCPSSRCDFGGEFPVRNVVQSGVLGSVALCLPNFVGFGGTDYVPVCLSGVKAGVDNWASITDSYVQCLNTSLREGKTVGICNNIYSIYGCQLFWQEIRPFFNFAVPTVGSLITGSSSSSGGGEYAGGIHTALQNAQKSVEYITQNYASESYNAFKARSQQDIGTTVCKNALSQVFPVGQELVGALGQTQSPAQFTGTLQAIPFSTVTNPPQYQYKVYYHIYAGNNAPANYQVYLKAGASSYYNDASIPRIVDTGYIDVGKAKDVTKDFTAPQGYTQLCIQVNGQEECGFGSVTTNFASNYLAQNYIKNQATENSITTQDECISGTIDLTKLFNLNVQDGITNTLSPNLQDSGVTRVCSSENPGVKSDSNYPGPNQRWIRVGTCGNSKIGCWIDKQSVENAMNTQWQTYNKTLKSLGDTLRQNLQNMKGLMTDEQYFGNVTLIKKTTDAKKRISIINGILNKVYGGPQKGLLILLRGNAYRDLAVDAFHNLPICGNEIIQGKEECDGANLNGKSCTDFGFTSGTLGCYEAGSAKQCTFDTSKCVGEGTPSAVDQFKDYISNVYSYVQSNPDGSHLYEYCYQFRKGVWYRSQKEGSSCGPLDSVATGSVVDGKGFLEGMTSLIERVKVDPSSRSLSAGNFVLGGGEFYFNPIKDITSNFAFFKPGELTANLTFSTALNSWEINYHDKRGPVVVNNADIIDPWTIDGFDYRNLFLNLTDKNLYQGALVLFEGKGFNFVEKNNPAGSTNKLATPEEIVQLESKRFVLQTTTKSDYSYYFSYLVKKGWYVKNAYISETMGITSQWLNLNNNDFSKNSEYSEIISLLNSMKKNNFLEGFKKLVTSSSGKLNSGKFSFLTYGQTSMSPPNSLKISNLESVGDIYFNYNYENNGEWLYGYDGTNWHKVDKKVGKSNPWYLFWKREDKTLTKDEFKFIKSLNGKSRLDGTLAIFSYSNPPPGNDVDSSYYGGDVGPLSLANCQQRYSDLVQSASDKYGIDKNLLFAVMYKESGCNANSPPNGNSYGLMQINVGAGWCGQFGLSSDKTLCKNQLEDPETNINVGAQILLFYYNKPSVTFNGCSNKNKVYTGWDAALRRYNGLGCENDDYVEQVNELKSQFESLGISSQSSSKSIKVLQAAQDLNGSIADPNQVCALENHGDFNCYTAVKGVYAKAGLDLDKDLKRIYSSGKGAKLKDGTTLGSHSDIAPYIGKSVKPELNELQKLNLIKPGDKIDMAYQHPDKKWVIHSVIFIGWVDKSTKLAKVFDWNGGVISQGSTDSLGIKCTYEKLYPKSNYCKTYRYNQIKLDNNDNYVYHIRDFV